MDTDVLATISAFLSAAATIGMFIISNRQIKLHKTVENDKNTPFLYPISHKFTKSEWERYYFAMDLNNAVKKTHYNQLSEEKKKYCQHCNDKSKKVFFYYLEDLILVLDGKDRTPDYLIEHHNAEIQFQNLGSLITRVHIDYVEQFFNNGAKVRYEGCDDSNYTETILPNQIVKIVLDEVKSDSNPSCYIGDEDYNKLKDYDIFKEETPPVIAYSQYIMQLSLWNQYNRKYIFQIRIYKKGTRFHREVQKIQDYEEKSVNTALL
jgi:hypothetical protein